MEVRGKFRQSFKNLILARFSKNQKVKRLLIILLNRLKGDIKIILLKDIKY